MQRKAIEITPAPEPRGWLDFLAGLPLPQEARPLLAARPRSVHVDPVGRRCRVVISPTDLTHPIPEEVLGRVEKALSRYLGCEEAMITLEAPDERPLADRLQEVWSRLLEDAEAAVPLTRPLLERARREISGQQLTLYLPDPVSVRFLERKGAAVALARACHRRLDVHLAVRFLRDVTVRQEEVDLTDEAEALAREAVARLAERPETSDAKDPTGVLLGGAVKGEIFPLREVQGEEDRLAVQGEVFRLESRLLRNGKELYACDITDFSDSLTLKAIVSPEDAEGIRRLTQGAWVRAEGRMQYDKFAKEPVLMVNRLEVFRPADRQDTAADKRVELHLHTKMSAMDAIVDIDRAVARARAWEHPALAVTDHGVVQAFPEAYEAGKRHGIKIIYGIEGYLQPGEDPRSRTYHIIILVRTQAGLRNLYRLVTASHLANFYRVPRIKKSELQELREGLIIGSACEAGELMRAVVQGASDEELLGIASFYDYLEIQPVANNAFMLDNGTVEDIEGLRDFNRKVLWLGNELDKPVVATGDVHFLEPQHEIYRTILLAGKGMRDTERETPLYLRTTDEMLEEFSYLGDAEARRVVIVNPRRIADSVEEVRPVPEGLHAPKLPGAEEEIREAAYERARELYGDPLPRLVEERLDQELAAIIDNGFAGLYLIARRLVTKSLSDGYLVGSRGSVGSSFVATMTGITEVNPLPPHYRCPACRHVDFVPAGQVGSGFDLPDAECPVCSTPFEKDGHDLQFAVFMGFKGDKVPDIDLNFSGEYQSQVHRYTEDLLGKESVFRAGTISTIADRTAYGFVRGYAQDRNLDLRTAEVNRLVSGCTGVKRTTGQHPGGLMVVPKGEDVYRFTPLQHPADDRESGTITTHFDYHSISSRLVKLDILGHDDPTVLRMLGDLTGVDVRAIPFDDPATMGLFSGLEPLGLTPEEAGSVIGSLGLPEFGTRFVRGMLEETRPTTFGELVRISGLSHGTDVWLNNAQELIQVGTANLTEVICARDDIMTFLIHKGMEPSLAFKLMEKVRKGQGLTPAEEEAMRQVEVPDWYIDSCQKIKYMFPKAHAVAYVMMAFRIAWFKVHRPEAFYATYFTVRADEFDAGWIAAGEKGMRRRLKELEKLGHEGTAKDKNQVTILEVALEMYARGIRFLPVDLAESGALRFRVTPEGLRAPFVSIPGLGIRAAESIAAAREEAPFSSREDLQHRARISKNIIELLGEHGALEGLPESDQMVLF